MKDLREAITEDTTVQISVATASSFLRAYGKKVRDAGGYYDTFTRGQKEPDRDVYLPATRLELVTEITSKAQYFTGTPYEEDNGLFVFHCGGYAFGPYIDTTAEEALACFIEDYKQTKDCRTFYSEYFSAGKLSERAKSYDYEALRRLLDRYTSIYKCITDPDVSLWYSQLENTSNPLERSLYAGYVTSVVVYRLHLKVITAALNNSDYIEEYYDTFSSQLCDDTRQALNF